jgi:hypothetical protein
MSSPPKPDDGDVPPSPRSEENSNGDDDNPKEADKPIMDTPEDIEVKEQDRWLPIANGMSLFPLAFV